MVKCRHCTMRYLDDTDKNMIAEFELTKAKVENLLEQYKFRDALFEVIDLAQEGQ